MRDRVGELLDEIAHFVLLDPQGPLDRDAETGTMPPPQVPCWEVLSGTTCRRRMRGGSVGPQAGLDLVVVEQRAR